MKRSFAGAGVALVTPFNADGSLDEPALRALVRRQVAAHIDVLVPCGTTGEAATMSEVEQQRVVSITLEEAGDTTVVAGAGANDTRLAVERTRAMSALGVHGVLSVGPYYNKPTPEGFFRHFTEVAEASTVPVVLYNVPSRTGSNIDVKTLLRLSAHANIAAVKEASASLGQIQELLRDRPASFQVLSGDDAWTLPLMAMGGEGVISVCANQVPGEMHELTEACARGDFAAARLIHNKLLKLMNLNFVESNPVPVKASLALLGLCREQFRLPLVPATDATRELLRAALAELGVQ